MSRQRDYERLRTILDITGKLPEAERDMEKLQQYENAAVKRAGIKEFLIVLAIACAAVWTYNAGYLKPVQNLFQAHPSIDQEQKVGI
jgi:p-aminobenzoyl-glutamate transporter AbgT